MDFSVMFFSSLDRGITAPKYKLLLEAARFADAHGFEAIWLPERHFHEFGGLFPNPSVVAAAVATATSRIQLRAGSVISPLHDPIRIAEEWLIVDNLSNGRVAMSFGSGWNAEDFVFFPNHYLERRRIMYEQIEVILRLWSGESVMRKGPLGKDISVRVFPRPVQKQPDLWITAGGSAETFASAGRIGANVLTSLEKLSLSTLTARIALFRSSLRANGFDEATRKVALMLHTFLGEDPRTVRVQAQAAMHDYLNSAIDLEIKAAALINDRSAGLPRVGGPYDPCQEDREFLTHTAFDRFFRNASLLGTVEERLPLVTELGAIGVDEIACLVDFLDSPDLIMEGLQHLEQLRERCGNVVPPGLTRAAQDLGNS